MARKSAAAPKEEAKTESVIPNAVEKKARVTLMQGEGGGTAEKHLFIVLYAAPKSGKTYAAAELDPSDTKWIISDPNTLATLRAIKKLPPKKNTYVTNSLADAKTLVGNMLDVAHQAEDDGEDPEKALDCSAMVFDSGTQYSDWHKEDVARSTGQRWLGDDAKNNGWNQFNQEFGGFIRDLTALARYTHVILICHANQKPNPGKGEWAGLALSPQMSELVARSANWLLYMTSTELTEEQAGPDGVAGKDPFISVVQGHGDEKRYVERIIHTQPYGGWNASAAGEEPEGGPLKASQPPSVKALLEKVGLL